MKTDVVGPEKEESFVIVRTERSRPVRSGPVLASSIGGQKTAEEKPEKEETKEPKKSLKASPVSVIFTFTILTFAVMVGIATIGSLKTGSTPSPDTANVIGTTTPVVEAPMGGGESEAVLPTGFTIRSGIVLRFSPNGEVAETLTEDTIVTPYKRHGQWIWVILPNRPANTPPLWAYESDISGDLSFLPDTTPRPPQPIQAPVQPAQQPPPVAQPEIVPPQEPVVEIAPTAVSISDMLDQAVQNIPTPPKSGRDSSQPDPNDRAKPEK